MLLDIFLSFILALVGFILMCIVVYFAIGIVIYWIMTGWIIPIVIGIVGVWFLAHGGEKIHNAFKRFFKYIGIS